MFYFRYRMCVRRRSHTCFIREQSSCHTFCECKLYRCSHCSATDCRRFKSTYNDRIKCIWDFFKVCKDYNQWSDNIKTCHDWNNRLCNFCNSGNSSDKYKQCDNRYNDPHHYLWYTKCSMKCWRYRVGLYRISHKSQCKNNQNRKDSCQDFSKSTFESRLDIINRSACYMPVFSYMLIFLSHNSFSENGRRNPHPENRSRSAYCQCCCRSCNIPRSYLCCNSRCKCLKWWHTVFSRRSFFRKQSAKRSFPPGLKSTYLDKSEPDRKYNTSS